MTLTASEAPVAAEDEGTTDKRKLVLIGGVAAVALAGGGWFLLGGSGGSSGPALGLPPGGIVTPAHVAPAVQPGVKPTKAPQPGIMVPAVSNARLGRDPFHALYVIPAASPPGGTAPGTTPTGSTPGTTGSTPGTGAPASAPYRLSLIGITGAEGKIYAFDVGGTKKSVVTTQKFGKYGELVVLAYVKDAKGAVTGALLQVGDDNPVTVKVGERITVL